MSWFNFFFGLKFLKSVSFLVSFVSAYGNEPEMKENEHETGLKI